MLGPSNLHVHTNNTAVAARTDLLPLQQRTLLARRKVAEAVVGAAGVDFWRLEEPTLWYIVGLLALQVLAREVFKRYGPFKVDAALFAHQVGGERER